MNDMAAAIIPKSDQINADDLIAGPMTITIASVKVVGGQEQPVSIAFEGSVKMYRPCKSMSRVLVAAWGPDTKAYIGRSLTLYRDPAVKWGGMAVGGIRISHMTNIDRDMTMMLTMTKQNRAPHTVKPLVVTQTKSAPAEMTAAQALVFAEAAAKKGADAFREWFNTDQGKDARATGALTADVMVDLKKVCADADTARSDDPFGLLPLDPAQTTDPEIEAQIAAEIAARNRELEGQA